MLRWAILGTSFISETMAWAIDASPGSVAVVVAGRDRAKLEDFRARHGIAAAVTSVHDAVTHPDVDVVYVGLPNHQHHHAVGAAAAAGRPVLSEKSLTVTMEQADELLAAVRGRVLFVEGLMYLAHPALARFMQLVGDGRLGTVKTVAAGYSADIWRLVNPAGGGAVFNLGCYPASLVQLTVDAVAGEGAFADHDLRAYGTLSAHDGNISETVAAVRFGCGITATLHTAETYGMAARFEVHGDRGTLAFLTNPWLPVAGANIIRWTPFDGEPEDIVVDSPLDAFGHQVRLMEMLVAADAMEAQRPSPRVRDSYELMTFLTRWEADARSSAVAG